jgi:hypothetical protein
MMRIFISIKARVVFIRLFIYVVRVGSIVCRQIKEAAESNPVRGTLVAGGRWWHKTESE